MRALWYAALVVVLDQVSKYLVRQHLDLHTTRRVVGDFFRLTYVENSGIVFGIKVGGALPAFTILSIIATVLILYYFFRERTNHASVRISLALVLGGAIGNLIDRIIFGRVVDFFDFGIGQYRFFVFNIADSAVTIGVIIFLLLTTFIYPHRHEEVSSRTERG
ncbi:MAG: signal peptidase II [Fidelibacterota bacterium]|nr:MAG: signal peptidase II [Candidatus Neomarinimicrobiota bacterium]